MPARVPRIASPGAHYSPGMCCRFLLTSPADVVAQAVGLSGPIDVPVRGPRYNIAPQQPVLAIREQPETRGAREGVLMKWGLIPRWAREPDVGNHPITCPIETADGFFEWKQVTAKAKQPLCIRAVRPGESVVGPFAIAALWDRWEAGDAAGSLDAIDSCAILTTAPNSFMQSVHDRMPAIVRPEDYDAWLFESVAPGDAGFARLKDICRPYPSELMTAYAVSRLVNSPRHDDPRCIEPARIGPDEPQLLFA